MSDKNRSTVGLLSRHAKKLTGDSDLDSLMERIGDARYVLLGEASHGTHEYYTWRMQITRRLIEEKGFSFVAVEGDWPDCYKLNRYVKGYTKNETAAQVLHTFNRWPTWMWANWETVAFAEWLKSHNDLAPQNRKAGFFGLDMYSLYESLEAIIGYLEQNDPDALETARKALSCFEPYGEEGQAYARATRWVPDLCTNEVVDLLYKISQRRMHDDHDPEQAFSTEQNAWVAVNAEKYYRAMIGGGPNSWNIRDRHMTDTLERLMDFHGKGAKAVVWEHNTHIGDARATDMAGEQLVNIGQLLREHHGASEVVCVGFGSYAGTVIAGAHWGDAMQEMDVPPAMLHSWEDLLHQAADGNDLLIDTAHLQDMKARIGHRAIGVVYDPQYEQYGNYVPSIIPERYDAFIFIDETAALHPLHIQPDGNQMPETYPFGM